MYSIHKTHHDLSGAAVVMAMGCCEQLEDQPEGQYRALLLPYLEKGASVAAIARTDGEGYLALLSPAEGHADHLRMLSIRGSEVAPFDEITVPDPLKARCPESLSAMFLTSVAFDLSPDGHGLLLAHFGCGRNPMGAVWFERVAGRFVWVDKVDTLLPDRYRPAAIAWESAEVCYFSFNRSLMAAMPEGPSSIGGARWRQGRFDALWLAEQETGDDRYVELRSLAAGTNPAMLGAVQTIAAGNGSPQDLARMFLFHDEPVDAVTGAEAFGALSPAHASARGTFVVGASTAGGNTAVLGISPAAGATVHARLSAAPDSLRTHVVLLDARVLEVLEQRLEDQSAGWKNLLALAGKPVNFPPVGLGASVAGLLVHGREALLFGEHLAKGPLGNLHAPLLVRTTDQRAPASVRPLPDETANDTCTVPVDCFGQDWGVRCQGHFGCVAGRCERICDTDGCGDGVCDTEGGESTAACLSDCAGSRDGGAADSPAARQDGAGARLNQSVEKGPEHGVAATIDLGMDGWELSLLPDRVYPDGQIVLRKASR